MTYDNSTPELNELSTLAAVLTAFDQCKNNELAQTIQHGDMEGTEAADNGKGQALTACRRAAS